MTKQEREKLERLLEQYRRWRDGALDGSVRATYARVVADLLELRDATEEPADERR